MMIDAFTPYRKKQRPQFAVFDFETDGFGGDILAASYMIEGDAEPSFIGTGDILQKLWDVMVAHCDCHWFAHNVEYELRYFTDRLAAYGERVVLSNRSDSAIYMVSIALPEICEDAALTIRDSLPLWPASLAKFAEIFAPELSKLDIGLSNGVTFDSANSTHVEYSKRDSETLLTCLLRFDAAIVAKFDVHVGYTAAGTAMRAWRATLDKAVWINRNEEDFIRSAYYGGIVFLTDNTEHSDCVTYDINSSYPHQMLTHAVPIGAPREVGAFDVKSPMLGIYDVTVETPPGLVVPILPRRNEKGVLLWNTGRFRTTVTSEELKFAVEHGYKILETHKGIGWIVQDKPFGEFISSCREIRQANKGTAYEAVAKLMQNSLYGKFGTRDERVKFKTTITPEEIETGKFESVGPFWRTVSDEKVQAMPQWAVFITARARLHLLRAVYDAGPENVIYGDTDSLTVKSHIEIPTGTEYGQFKREKIWKSFRAAAPKVYAGCLSDGRMAGAAKGIPRKMWNDAEVLKNILIGNDFTVRYTSVRNLVACWRTGQLGAVNAERSISKLSNASSWEALPGGKVRPRHCDIWERSSFPHMLKSAD